MKNLSLEDLTDALLDDTPENVLAQVLTESDLEALHNIKHELGICIKWGALTGKMYQGIMEGMDTLVFLETEKAEPAVVKRNPYEALFDRDKEIINGSTESSYMSRKYVLLQLTKKLLGALKTQVNKELSQMPCINDEVEGELREIIQYGSDHPSEEEMSLVDSQPTEVVAKIDASKCIHRRTTVKQIPSTKTASRMDELHTFCKDCKGFLTLRKLNSRSVVSARDWGKPVPCQHPNGSWKEGEEGKTAICSKCDSVVPNPQKFEWGKAGLEPFGDDPEKDEIQSFSMLKEMEA